MSFNSRVTSRETELHAGSHPFAMTRPVLRVTSRLQRGAYRTREEWLESGLVAVDLLPRMLERQDLSGVELLDVGCGTKIVKTLLDHEMPIGHYVGIDAASEVIEWLRASVSDPRFEFHRLDAHNEMYNPTGRDLASLRTWRRTTSMRCCDCCGITSGGMGPCSSPSSSTTRKPWRRGSARR